MYTILRNNELAKVSADYRKACLWALQSCAVDMYDGIQSGYQILNAEHDLCATVGNTESTITFREY